MPILLHLTDLHFGWDKDDAAQRASRTVCLDGILTLLRQLPPEWRPDIVCLTGDIGWAGSARDYSEAKAWTDRLLEVCQVSYESVLVCAGNHDVIRTVAKKFSRSSEAAEADEVLAPPIAAYHQQKFEGLTKFCQDCRIPPLRFEGGESSLVGTRTVRGIRFVVLNSSWFCKDNHDKDKLWVGLPHLKSLEAAGDLPPHPNPQDHVTVGLLHHPEDWLHTQEIHATMTRPATFDYLAERCHILLSGHTHAGVRRPDREADHALHFTGGSAYDGAAHFNSFHLLQIENGQVTDRAFEFDPDAPSDAWRPHSAKWYPLGRPQSSVRVDSPAGGPPAATDLTIELLRGHCRRHAQNFLARKSRLLKQTGPLPETIRRPVSEQVSRQHNEFTTDGQLVRKDDRERTLPLAEAVRSRRRALLLGDLGGGKSTLAAGLVIESMEVSADGVAFFVPVKSLNLPERPTLDGLLAAIDAYVQADICVAEVTPPLKSLLQKHVEILLVLDGLDELALNTAGGTLAQAARLEEQWPRIQVIATARPIEMNGVDFTDWHQIHTVPLDDPAKRQFLRAELAAEGVSADRLDEEAERLLQTLKNSVALDSLANSPLVIRLLYPKLRALSTNSHSTLGNILYDILQERLHGWQQRDDKPQEYAHLSAVLPTGVEKVRYLAVLAQPIAGGQPLHLPAARARLEAAAAKFPGANAPLLSEQALSFFVWLGLISPGDRIEFPLQPLAEVAAAVGLVEQWHAKPEDDVTSEPNLWRVVSFASAIGRSRGWLDMLRDPLRRYLELLLRDRKGIPAACYIVAEANDSVLARAVVAEFRAFGFRPLTIFGDEWRISTRNIALTLFLAHDEGFNWFYEQYLDPRYPTPNAGSSLNSGLFRAWAVLAGASLKPRQKTALAKMVEPFKAVAEGHFYGVLNTLVMLVPENFEPAERSRRLAGNLEDEWFAESATRALRKVHEQSSTAGLAEDAVRQRSASSAVAARLWFEWNPDGEPAVELLHLAFQRVAKAEGMAQTDGIVRECRSRLGETRWLRFARWCLTDASDSVAVGAAKILFESGEKRLLILGDVFLRGMHDGAYLPAAEQLLALLIEEAGDSGVVWLARQVAWTDREYGAHTAWWRLLLSRIDALEDGPEQFADCVHNLGKHALPRFPEVRAGFQHLLNGSRGERYFEVLRQLLANPDPDARRAAARILIACDPEREAEALHVSVRTRTRDAFMDDHGWETFCLSLSFGPGVLAFLESKLASLSATSRALALIILAKGGRTLSGDQTTELLATVLQTGHFHLRSEPVVGKLFSQASTFDWLREILHGSSQTVQTEAANMLLQFHAEKLSSLERAKCRLIQLDRSSWVFENPPLLNTLAGNWQMATELAAAENEMAAQSRHTVVGLAAKTVLGEASWKDLVWEFLCGGRGLGGRPDSEDAGMTLLEFGLDLPDYRSRIGAAAEECLLDPRMVGDRQHDSFHWLAVLADQFAGPKPEKISSVILHGQPISYEATAALIARLGYVPPSFHCRRHANDPAVPVPLVNPGRRDQAAVLQNLREMGRDSGVVHPGLLPLIESSLFLEPFDDTGLASIADSGQFGVMTACSLRFVDGRPPRLIEAIPALSHLTMVFRNPQRPSDLRLARIWQVAKSAALKGSSEQRDAYAAALGAAMQDGRFTDLAIVLELLDLQGGLKAEQIPVVFTACTTHPTMLPDVLFARLASWIAEGVGTELQPIVLHHAEEAILQLNETPWESVNSDAKSFWAGLFFPTIFWASGGTSSAAAEVFLRGMRGAFDQTGHPGVIPRLNAIRLLEIFEPLIKKIPTATFVAAIRRGNESAEPSIRGFCHLLRIFGRAISEDPRGEPSGNGLTA